jgi:HSP20 family protein
MVMNFLNRRYPTSDVSELDREIDNLFRPVFETDRSWGPGNNVNVDVAEYPDRTEVVAEVPGVSKEDLKVTVLDGVLTVKGERKRSDFQDGRRTGILEIPSGAFSRSVRIPHGLNLEQLRAALNNGILRIVLPKNDEARPREIAVQ